MQVVTDIGETVEPHAALFSDHPGKPLDRGLVARMEHGARATREAGPHDDVERALGIDGTHCLSLARAKRPSVFGAEAGNEGGLLHGK
jgi:hypothetical protein